MVLKVTNSRLAAITWSLIFGGMLSLALGLVIRRNDATIGTVLVVVAGLAICVGIVLVWVRSRRPDGGA